MIENLETYININGYPIIRRCFNCRFWKAEIFIRNQKPLGYCKFSPLYFAFTLQPTVYPITRDFYLCEKHEFENQIKLELFSEKVSLKDSIRKKEDID